MQCNVKNLEKKMSTIIDDVRATHLTKRVSLEKNKLQLPPPPPTIFHPIYHKKKSKRLKKSSGLKKSIIVINYNVGVNNTLYIRGTGPGMSWEKGIPLKNASYDQWIWEHNGSFETFDFKILINNSEFENGDNHHIACGEMLSLTPSF
jgi:hypothetical protein